MQEKKINNSKDGHHFSSKYWQDYKKTLPLLSDELIQIAVGMILGDACICRRNNEAFIKFEQGSNQQVEHLFSKFNLYCFMEKPSHRFMNQNKFSSYCPSFTKLFLLFFFSLL